MYVVCCHDYQLTLWVSKALNTFLVSLSSLNYTQSYKGAGQTKIRTAVREDKKRSSLIRTDAGNRNFVIIITHV